MRGECLSKDSPNKLYLPKQMGEDQLDDLELDGPITLRILGGIAMDFTTSEVMDVIEDREEWRPNLELLPRNFHGKAGNEERKRRS